MTRYPPVIFVLEYENHSPPSAFASQSSYKRDSFTWFRFDWFSSNDSGSLWKSSVALYRKEQSAKNRFVFVRLHYFPFTVDMRKSKKNNNQTKVTKKIKIIKTRTYVQHHHTIITIDITKKMRPNIAIESIHKYNRINMADWIDNILKRALGVCGRAIVVYICFFFPFIHSFFVFILTVIERNIELCSLFLLILS